MTPQEREDGLQGLEKAVEELVDIQWRLNDLHVLTPEVRNVLTEVGTYYLEALLVHDTTRALALTQRLAEKVADRKVTTPTVL